MTREELITKVNGRLKLVRTEYGLTQDKMAAILGISKKTLVESEKGRRSLGWTETVALTSIFEHSSILKDALGEDFNEMISALALEGVEISYPPTMGGKVWWREIKSAGGYRIQQNLISNHYRLLDEKDRRLISSFDLKEVEDYLEDLV
ncbi:MAG: transcriptional regulator [Clostridiales bacterium]|nr:transcriptional regulator [Clostridiales bacterium]MBP3810381.1 transcriptional regulator [Clostridiales bacterium]